MLRDAEYFKSRIGTLDGAGDTGDYIIKIVKEKNVPKVIPPAPVPEETNGTRDEVGEEKEEDTKEVVGEREE